MTNRYPGKCIECKTAVEANAGECRKSKAGRWYVLCSEHARPETGRVYKPRFRSIEARYAAAEAYEGRMGGKDYFTNPRGRCEDAPCCGCCS